MNMETEDQSIKNIFQEKFKSPSPIFEVNDLDAIQLKVAQKKFYHFKPTQFNIYYAVAIACTFMGMLALGTDYLLTKKKIEAELEVINNKMNERNTVAKLQNNTEFLKAPTIKLEAQKQVTNKKIANAGKSIKDIKLSHTSKNQHAIDANVVIKLPKDSSVSLANKPIDLKPKTVYIIKQDTIIRYDSVKVKRRKK